MKKNNHIAIFVPSFLGGGVERMMVYLANNFVGKGFSVDYVVIKNVGPYKSLLSKDINLIDLKKSRVVFSLFALAKYLRKNRPDVILSAMNYVNILTYLANLISLTKTKLVISERDIPSNNINKSKFKSFFKLIITYAYPRTHKIIAISKDVKTDLVNTFNIKSQKILVVNNMVDLRVFDFEFENQKPELFRELFSEEFVNQKIVIAIGRLVPYKNFDYLIESFSLISKENKNIKLLILGEGIERENLERQIRELNLESCVKLPGFLEDSHIYLKISDAFISTSKYEGFGNVIIEALAAGLPVIVSDCKGGPKEIVDYGKYGDIVPLDNANAVASILLEKVNINFDSSISINRSKDFSIEKIAQQYLNVLLHE